MTSGLLLEKSGIIISWGASVEELRHADKPDVVDAAPRHDFTWKDERVFEGLPASVYATLYGEQHLSELEIMSNDPFLDETFESRHSRIKKHLIKVFGNPINTWKHPYVSLPSFEWQVADYIILLCVSERFGKYCYISVKRWHKKQ